MSTDVKTMNRKVFKAGMKNPTGLSIRTFRTSFLPLVSVCLRMQYNPRSSRVSPEILRLHTPVGYTWTVSWPIAVSRNHGTDLP